MAELMLQFELDQAEDADRLANQLQTRLAALNDVEEAEAEPVESRFIGGGVGEAVAVIAAGVMLVREGRDLVAGVRAFLQEIKGLLQDMNEVREVYLEIRGRKIALGDIRDADLAELENT